MKDLVLFLESWIEKNVMRQQRDYLPRLLDYIEVANQVQYVPSRIEIIQSIKYENKKASKITDSEIFDGYKEFIGRLPTYIKKELFNLKGISEKQRNKIIVDRLQELSNISKTLFKIGYCVTEEYKIRSEKRGETCVHFIMEDLEEVFPEYIPTLPIRVTINKDGFLATETTKFIDFITQNKIEGFRIRCCVICDLVFWATRLDKWTCSKSCGNINRQRLWQEENKDSYNEKRRNNYAYKKSLNKKKGEIKNGTL